jgi:ABC-type transporter Mla maintaining outer membrane lipid asymmetry ATPase subunit MlaF
LGRPLIGPIAVSKNSLTKIVQPVIELDDLTVCFGKREILKNLRIALFGRIIGLLGSNGHHQLFAITLPTCRRAR